MAVGCESCKYGTYSLARGKITYKTLQSPPLIENHKCSQCQKGSVCDIDVRAKANHWGHNTMNSNLTFYTCAEQFCCQNSVECYTFDSCSPRRRGTLCGECRKGFKLSLLTSDCIPNEELCKLLLVQILFFDVWCDFYWCVYRCHKLYGHCSLSEGMFLAD